MDRSLTRLPLPEGLLQNLQKRGFRTCGDIVEVPPSKLANELEVSHQEALELWKSAKKLDTDSALVTAPDVAPTPASSSQMPKLDTVEKRVHKKELSALEILQRDAKTTPIISFCQAFDNLFDGGIPRGQLTDICGEPGVGKTQLGIQLTVNVQIPKGFGGVAGEAFFIDTEGSFMIERVAQMAKSLVAYLRRKAKEINNLDLMLEAEQLTFEKILSRIHYNRVYNYTEQLAVIDQLDNFLTKHPNIKVVVIDSISFLFRVDFANSAMRSRKLVAINQKLQTAARRHMVAVINLNQFTTKVSSGERARLVPALGNSYSHGCTNRIILSWRDSQRLATLVKSPSHKKASAPYAVTADGFRDVQTESCAHSKRKYSFAQDLQPGDSPHAKRVHRDGI